MRHDTVDVLAQVMSDFVDKVKAIPGLLKADVDSAFRRVPVAPEHRWACGVAFKCEQTIYISMHAACPFGAIASVHAWERVGAAIAHIARKFLKLAVLRYVDDLFAPERRETMEHALQCLARLIRVLLGPTAVANDKLACGKKLDVLGVDIKMSSRGYKCRPKKKKAKKWVKIIQQSVAKRRLAPGEASKMAGRLSWGSSHLFRKLGRAMLRPLFDQKTRRDGRMPPELERSLRWWEEVLQRGLCEGRKWKQEQRQPVNLFCDASGFPAYLGAVVMVDDKCYYTHMAPSSELMGMFRRRRDNQIMGLELLSISLGLCTFENLIRGRNVIVHSDNTGSEVIDCMYYR